MSGGFPRGYPHGPWKVPLASSSLPLGLCLVPLSWPVPRLALYPLILSLELGRRVWAHCPSLLSSGRPNTLRAE